MLEISNLLGIKAHVEDKNNPHGVNKEQLDLGKVQNMDVASQRSQYENKTAGLYASAAGVGDYVQHKLNPITEAINNLNIPTFASNAEALGGTLTGKLINPSNLKYVLDNKIPGFATNAQIDSGTATNVIVSPAGMKRYVQNNLPDDVTIPEWATSYNVLYQSGTIYDKLMSPARTAELLDHRIPKSTETKAVEGTFNHGYMTPQLVKKAIDALGSNFAIKQIDSGRYGVFWDKKTGFGIQWGQTIAMGPSSSTKNYFITDFVGKPFNVWGSATSYFADSGNPAEQVEVDARIINKSINNDNFIVSTMREFGGNTDGVVFTWCAIGFVDPYNKGFRQTDGGKNRSVSISHSNTGLTGTPSNSSGHLVGK